MGAEALYRKYRRQLMIESVKRFWKTFKGNKKGITGLSLFSILLTLAIAAPVLAPFDPDVDKELADPVSPPEWAAIFPGYENLPPNLVWNISPEDWSVSSEGLEIKREGSSILFSFSGAEEVSKSTASLSYEFDYSYNPPKMFAFLFNLDYATDIPYDIVARKGVKAAVTATITRLSDEKSYVIYDQRLLKPFSSSQTVNSLDQRLLIRNRLGALDNFASVVFSEPGTYRLNILITLEGSGGKAELKISDTSFKIRGRMFGLLGTDYLGRDVWSLFVWGARSALMAGLMIASGIVGFGVILGLLSGYKGGFADRVMMFAADTMYLIPSLPLIFLAILIFGRNLWIAIAIVIVFGGGYAAIARQIRAWVMSLKERPFVESAKLSGCSDRTIMFKYILPQTAPYLVFVFVLSVPSGIFLIFALELLGLGDPKVPSWGRTLGEAWYGGALLSNAWWWITPPIIGLFITALGFVLMGYALDEIVNPRLRIR